MKIRGQFCDFYAVDVLFPVAGNAVGAVAGFVVGVTLYWATDVIQIDDRTVRDITKDYYNSFG